MKHALWYKADGVFGGVIRWQGGIPAGVDASDMALTPEGGTFHPNIIQGQAAVEAAYPGQVVGWVEYTCACNCSGACADGACKCVDGFCGCVDARYRDSYYDTVNGVIVTKPAVDMKIDNVVAAPNTQAAPDDRTPVTSFTFKLQENVADTVPDGATAQVEGLVGSLHQSLPQTLTFTGGVTNEITLVAPSQGVTCAILVHGKYVTPQQLHVRGWT